MYKKSKEIRAPYQHHLSTSTAAHTMQSESTSVDQSTQSHLSATTIAAINTPATTQTVPGIQSKLIANKKTIIRSGMIICSPPPDSPREPQCTNIGTTAHTTTHAAMAWSVRAPSCNLFATTAQAMSISTHTADVMNGKTSRDAENEDCILMAYKTWKNEDVGTRGEDGERKTNVRLLH